MVCVLLILPPQTLFTMEFPSMYLSSFDSRATFSLQTISFLSAHSEMFRQRTHGRLSAFFLCLGWLYHSLIVCRYMDNDPTSETSRWPYSLSCTDSGTATTCSKTFSDVTGFFTYSVKTLATLSSSGFSVTVDYFSFSCSSFLSSPLRSLSLGPFSQLAHCWCSCLCRRLVMPTFGGAPLILKMTPGIWAKR